MLTLSGKGLHPRSKALPRPLLPKEVSLLLAASALTECHNCKKKGHYSSHCLSRSVTAVTIWDSTDYNTSYLTAVTGERSSTSWNTTVAVNGYEVTFKLDTGVEVTMISDQAVRHSVRKSWRAPRKDCADKTIKHWMLRVMSVYPMCTLLFMYEISQAFCQDSLLQCSS